MARTANPFTNQKPVKVLLVVPADFAASWGSPERMVRKLTKLCRNRSGGKPWDLPAKQPAKK